MATDSTPTADSILADAVGPASVTVDGMTVVSGNTNDQLAAMDVANANRNATKKRRGLLFARITPGSAVGCDRRRS